MPSQSYPEQTHLPGAPADDRWRAMQSRPAHGVGIGGLRPIHVLLFFATLLTTTLAGSFQAGANPFADPWLLGRGLPFSITLMSILLVHEMGHFVMSRWHGV